MCLAIIGGKLVTVPSLFVRGLASGLRRQRDYCSYTSGLAHWEERPLSQSVDLSTSTLSRMHRFPPVKRPTTL